MKIVLDNKGMSFGYARPILIPTTKGEKEFIKAARLPNGNGCRPWVYTTIQWLNAFGTNKYILENQFDISDWEQDSVTQCYADELSMVIDAVYDYAKNDQEWYDDGSQPEVLNSYTPSNACLLSIYHLFKNQGGKVKMAKCKKYDRKFAHIKKLYKHLLYLREQYFGERFMTFAHEKEREEEMNRIRGSRRVRKARTQEVEE